MRTLKTAYRPKHAYETSGTVRNRQQVNGVKHSTKARQSVMLVSNSTWNIYNFRLPVIRMLLEQYEQVTVAAPVDEYIHNLVSIKGLEIIPLRNLSRKSLGVSNNLILGAELYGIYRTQRPDLVIHFTIKPNIFGNLAAALLKIPSICVVTGLGYTFMYNGFLQFATTLLYRFSFRFAKNIVFENAPDRDLMVEKKITQQAKTTVVPGCGVDTQHFYPNGQHPNPDKIVFTFIGRLLIDKGIKEFVQAARVVKNSYPNAEFWVLGGLDDGNPAHIDRTTLLDWVRDGLIQYKGTTSDVRPFIAQSDWIVLPSYREGLSRVLLEAMAMAKPLITTDTAGCRETVESGKNGYLVPVKDDQALALAMEYCCTLSKQETAQMGRYGRKKVQREFEHERVGKAYLKLVHEIL